MLCFLGHLGSDCGTQSGSKATTIMELYQEATQLCVQLQSVFIGLMFLQIVVCHTVLQCWHCPKPASDAPCPHASLSPLANLSSFSSIILLQRGLMALISEEPWNGASAFLLEV